MKILRLAVEFQQPLKVDKRIKETFKSYLTILFNAVPLYDLIAAETTVGGGETTVGGGETTVGGGETTIGDVTTTEDPVTHVNNGDEACNDPDRWGKQNKYKTFIEVLFQ